MHREFGDDGPQFYSQLPVILHAHIMYDSLPLNYCGCMVLLVFTQLGIQSSAAHVFSSSHKVANFFRVYSRECVRKVFSPHTKVHVFLSTCD